MSNNLNIAISASLLQSSLNALTGKDINDVEYALAVLVTAATTSPFIKTLILRDNRKKLCNALLACAVGNLRSSSAATLSALEIMVAVADASSVFTRNANTEIGIRPLLAILKKPNQIELTMELTCTLLLVMAKNNKKFGLTMRLEGGVLLVCSILPTLSVDTVSLFLKLCQVLEKCCRELSTYTSPSNFTSTIVTYNDNNIKIALKKGIPLTVIEFIKANQTYATAVEICLNLLSTLCGTNDQNVENIIDTVPSSQLFSILTSILRYHYENINVCLATFKFINALAADSDTCVKLCAAHVFTQGWNAAVHHAHDTEVLQIATSAMWRIVTGLHRANNQNSNGGSKGTGTNFSSFSSSSSSVLDEAKMNNTVSYGYGYCPLAASLFRDNILKSVHGHSILVGNQPLLPSNTTSSASSSSSSSGSLVWEGLPPATVTLWPLPRYYGGDTNYGPYVMNLMNTMHSLPRWAAPYLPRTGYYPLMPNYGLTIKSIQLNLSSPSKFSSLSTSTSSSSSGNNSSLLPSPLSPNNNSVRNSIMINGRAINNDKLLTVNTAVVVKGFSSSAPATPSTHPSDRLPSDDTASIPSTVSEPFQSSLTSHNSPHASSESPSHTSNRVYRPRSGGTRTVNRNVQRTTTVPNNHSNGGTNDTLSTVSSLSGPNFDSTVTDGTIETLSQSISANLILAADRPSLSPGKRVRTTPSFVTRAPKVSLEITGFGGNENGTGTSTASTNGGKPFRMLSDALEHARSTSPTKSSGVLFSTNLLPNASITMDRSPLGKDPLLYPQQNKSNPLRLSVLPSSSSPSRNSAVTPSSPSSSPPVAYNNMTDGFTFDPDHPLPVPLEDENVIPSATANGSSSTVPSVNPSIRPASLLRPTIVSPSRTSGNRDESTFSTVPFTAPPGPMTISSAWESTRSWLHTPHWYPELQLSSALLPETAFLRTNELVHRSLNDTQTKTVSLMCEDTLDQSRASIRGATMFPNRTGTLTMRRTPLKSINPSVYNSVKTNGYHPASNIPKVAYDSSKENWTTFRRLQDISLALVSRSIRTTKYFFNPSQVLNERRIPTVPGLPIALTSNGFTIDRNQISIRIPRVYVTRSGMATVRRMMVPPSKLPTAYHCQPPVCEIVLDRRIITTGSTITNIVKNTNGTVMVSSTNTAKGTVTNGIDSSLSAYPSLMHPLAKGYLLLRSAKANNLHPGNPSSSSSSSVHLILPPLADDSVLNERTFFKHVPGGNKMDAPEPMAVCTSEQRASVAARFMLHEIARAGVAAGQLMQHRLSGPPMSTNHRGGGIPLFSAADEGKRSCLNALDTHYSSNSSSNLGSATSSRRGSSSEQHTLSPSASLPFDKPSGGTPKGFLTLSRLVYHRYTPLTDTERNTVNDAVPAIMLTLPVNSTTDNGGGNGILNNNTNVWLTRADFSLLERLRPSLPYRDPFIGYAVPIALHNGTGTNSTLNGHELSSSSSSSVSQFSPDIASIYDTLPPDEALNQSEPGPTCPLSLSGSNTDEDRRMRSNGGKDDDEDSQFSEEDDEEHSPNVPNDGTETNHTNDENSSIDDNSIDDKDKHSVDDQPPHPSSGTLLTEDTVMVGTAGTATTVVLPSSTTPAVPTTVENTGLSAITEKQILGSLTDALIPSAIAAHNSVVQAKLVREAVNRADVTAILSEAADEVAAMLSMHQKDTEATAPDAPTASTTKGLNGATTLRAQMMAVVPPLEFESRFECGNLASAVRIGPFEYELTLDPDTNTGGHTQWFFFRVRNMVGNDATLTIEQIDPLTGKPRYQRIPLYPEPSAYLNSTDLQPVIPGHNLRATLERNEKSLQQPPPCVYRFHIVNLEKGGSTFNDGMRPLVYFETAPSDRTELTNPLSRKEWRRKWYPRPPPIPGLEHIVLDDDDEDDEAEEQRKKIANENKHVPNAQYIPSPATSSSYHVPTLPGSGWRRAGFDIVYYRNQYSRMKEKVHPPIMDDEGSDMTTGTVISYQSPDNPNIPPDEIKPTSQYSQTWSIAFPSGVHTAFFAYCFPYTYTDLRRDMVRWESRALRLSDSKTNNDVPIREWDSNAVGSEIDNLHYDEMGDDTLQNLSKTVMTDIATSLPSGTFLPTGYTTVPQPFATRIPSILPLPLSLPIGSQFMSSIMHRTILCTTLAGNPVPLLTITDFASGPAALALRPYIVLSARVHPGETNGSWMMRGVIDMLTSSAPIAVELRKRIIFKIIPFLNPDGVINGHHRTGLAGLDLNRHWTNPDIHKAPTIWHLRTLIMSIQSRAASQALLGSTDTLPYESSIPSDVQVSPSNTTSNGTVDSGSIDGSILMDNSVTGGTKTSAVSNTALPILPPVSQPCIFFCDFHGHSRRRNVFTFGCHELPFTGDTMSNNSTNNTTNTDSTGLSSSNATGNGGSSAYSSSRTFPKLLASRIDTFAFGDCSWKVQKDKANCARVAMWRDALLPSSYTIEASFAGPDTGTQKGIHFTTRQYEEVGYAFVASLLDFVEGPIGTRMGMAVQRLRTDTTSSNNSNLNSNTTITKSMNDENINTGNDGTNNGSSTVNVSSNVFINSSSTMVGATVNNPTTFSTTTSSMTNLAVSNHTTTVKPKTDSASGTSSKPALLKKLNRNKKPVQDAEIIIYGGKD